jgi:SAM-dependent methyltransferase
MRSRVHEVAATGYSAAAELYAAARPSFPPAAVDWLTSELGLQSGDQVVELGAGTGKFTSLLVERGLRVVAVEPVAEMRERLDNLGDAVRAIDATAEKLPFDASSVHAVIASQSLHWADVDRAFAELDRVIAHPGFLGLIWNFRDVSVRWQQDIDALLAELRGSAPHSRDGRWQKAADASPFEIVGRATWSWTTPSDAAGVLARVRSVSYVAALPEEVRRSIDGRVRDILESHGLAHGTIPFPYVTEAYVLRRRA